MAMVVKNNMSAVRTLNTLNQNSSALQKSLAKVSSGMKINSAQDDASGYAISERMRVQIRSLDQANQNTQNGSSLMKTAEGAVSSTVEILKSLKEKAINAANDTNKDSDRATIQKEIDQFIDQIDDNALTTFNGKYLVDGSKSQKGDATYTAMTNQSLATDTTATTALTNLKNRNNESLEISATDSITVSYVRNGKTQTTTFKVADQNLGNIFDKADSIEDSKIFAGTSNKSVAGTGVTLKDGVEPQISESTGVDSADATSGTTSSSGAYSLDELQSALSSAKSKAADAAEALEAANAKAGAFTFDTTNGVGTDTTKNYGAAAELAQAIQEAASLKADGTKVAIAGGYYNTGDFIKTAATGAALASGVGTVGIAATNGASAGTANVFNGRQLDGVDNPTNSYNKEAIEAAITAMTASSNTTVAEAGNKLKEAYTNWNVAMNELTEAKAASDVAEKDVQTLSSAVTAITAKEEADALISDMASQLEDTFNTLAHPNATASTNIKLNNDNWLGTKLYPSTGGTQAADYNKVYQYSGDTDGSLAKAASSIANDIAQNVYSYATDTATAGTYTKNLVKEIFHIDAQANNAKPTTGGAAFASADYTNAGADDLTDATSDGYKPFADFAAKAGEYVTAKKQADEDAMDGDLKTAMDHNSSSGGGSSSTIGILTGSYVGANAAGDAVYTADGTNGITVTANNEGIGGQVSGLTISVTDSEGNVKKAANASLDDFRTTIFAKNKSDANELSFQVGANANQAIAVGLEDMRSEALGLKSSDGTKVSVATQERANAAVAVFDNAINKALDQQTTIGSIEARLEYTSSNLTTSSENVQAAESTIRDADMAKEMTNYTKNNVLLQAAQSMLAQANQSSSAVLSLLQ